jgi:thiol-disulfide isomerase/thioredoxin
VYKYFVVALCACLCPLIVSADTPKALDSVAKIDDLLSVVKNTGAKVILVNIWGITCSPCKAEMPVLTQAAERFKENPGVAFLGLCIPEEGDAKEKIQTAAAEIVKQRQVSYRNLVWSGSGDALLEKFKIDGTPYTVLLSAEGKQLAEVKIPLEPSQALEAIKKSINAALAEKR